MQYQALMQFSTVLCETIKTSVLPYFGQTLAVHQKLDTSPVTIADQETEQALRHVISTKFPDHGIYGEECGQHNIDAEYVWIIDPIDGTKAFITGIPLFTTLIGLLHHGQPIFGMMLAPSLDECWIGFKGKPTLFNGQALAQLNQAITLAEAKLLATTPDMFVGKLQCAFTALSQQVQMRRFGTDGYGYGLLARGFADCVVEADLKPYDCLALVPILAGVGAVMTDWYGAPLSLKSDGCVIAAQSPALHQQILSVLQTYVE